MKQTSKTTRTKPGIEDLERMAAADTARQQFLSASFGMGWRLAIAVVVPIVAGFKLDQYWHSAPALTLIGLMVATIAAVIIVKDAIRDLSPPVTPKKGGKHAH